MVSKNSKKTMKKSVSLSKRVISMKKDPNSVWGKNKPLEKFWKELASGKKVVLIEKDKHKMHNMPTSNTAMKKEYDSFNEDPNIIAVLSSNMSQDSYELFLYPKAKGKSVEYVIKNYKKFFKPIGMGKMLLPA